jgi:hypothetical protein
MDVFGELFFVFGRGKFLLIFELFEEFGEFVSVCKISMESMSTLLTFLFEEEVILVF